MDVKFKAMKAGSAGMTVIGDLPGMCMIGMQVHERVYLVRVY